MAIWLYGLVSVSESVSVKFSALYLVSKVSEKSGIGPPLVFYFVCFCLCMVVLLYFCNIAG